MMKSLQEGSTGVLPIPPNSGIYEKRGGYTALCVIFLKFLGNMLHQFSEQYIIFSGSCLKTDVFKQL
jgi:hypothetical protein